jgi:hypothetical protein
MDFIKKNYEKIILSIVLLGLVAAAGFLPVLIAADTDATSQYVNPLINPPATPLHDLDMSNEDAVILRIKSNSSLDFTSTNRLFNPMMWQKDRNGTLIKIVTGSEVGGGAVVVAKITPLYYEIALQEVITNEEVPRYEISVANQASDIPAQRHAQPHYLSVGEKAVGMELKGVKGPPENPTELDLVLNDTGQTVTVAPGNPYRQVAGYVADLKYPPENLNFPSQRVNSQLNFAGDQYNIIAIGENNVVLLAQSNQKKYVLPYSP